MTSSSFLTERYVYDLVKPDVDRFARAALLRDYMKDSKISLSEFCRRFNVPKGTVHGWLLWNELSDVDYQKQLASGSTPTQIFKRLRGDSVAKTDLERYLEDVKRELSRYKYVRELEATPRTQSLIAETVDALNNLSVTLSLKDKRRKSS